MLPIPINNQIDSFRPETNSGLQCQIQNNSRCGITFLCGSIARVRGSGGPPHRSLSCPPQSPCVAPPWRCSFLISSSSPRRYASARSSSSRQHTAQVPQLPTDSFAHPCVVVAFLYLLRLYVRHCNITPSPWWLLCLQWSVLPTTRTARAAVRVDRPTLSRMCHALCHA